MLKVPKKRQREERVLEVAASVARGDGNPFLTRRYRSVEEIKREMFPETLKRESE